MPYIQPSCPATAVRAGLRIISSVKDLAPSGAVGTGDVYKAVTRALIDERLPLGREGGLG
jgi:hypothetical protein